MPNVRRSRRAHIMEALLEYMVSLLVTGAFLSAILKQVGVSDAVTGIVSSFISVACVAQLFSGLIVRPNHSVKRVVMVLGLVNQLMFAMLYLIPFFNVPQNVKVGLFVVMILGAYLLLNVTTPAKFKWLMSFVGPGERGIFTARKEIISLIGGMAFTLCMGRLVDYFKAIGQERTGFILCGVTIFVVSVLHFVSLLMTDDVCPGEKSAHVGPRAQLREVASLFTSHTAFRKLLMVDVLWKTAMYLSTPYYGTYLIGELGFTMTYVSILSIVYGVMRALVSRRFGRFADTHSWSSLMTLCLGISAVSFFVNMFTCPANGHVVYTIYYALSAVSMAGINGGLTNITYDYVEDHLITHALGGRNAISGLCGFLASLCGGAIVGAIQAGGNQLFGATIYAQQVLSGMACVIIVALCLYMHGIIGKMPRLEQRN